MERIPNITGLRFFLAVVVLLLHVSKFCGKHEIPFYNAAPIFHKGYEAVCMFFALSGFLIIRQLYVEKGASQTISLKNFYLRRALRIFPLYFLILSFGLTYYNFILPGLGYSGGYNNNYNLWEGILLCVFFMPNVFAGLYSPGGIIEILWSIGVEEQFYLFIAPMLFLVSLRKTVLFLLLCTFVFFMVYFNSGENLLSRYDMLFFYFTSSGILSILLLKHSFLLDRKLVAIAVLLCFVFYFTTDVFIALLSTAGYHFFSMLLFAVAIGVLSCKPYGFLNYRFTTYLGKISYGIYVYHAIVIHLMGLLYLKVFAGTGINYYLIVALYNIAVLIITVVVSHLSYQYFEKYFMNLYNRKSLLRKNVL